MVVETIVIIKCVAIVVPLKTAFRALSVLIMGIKLVAVEILPVSIYIAAPPIIVGSKVNRLILRDPSLTVFALNDSILIIEAVKKANTPVTIKNNKT